MTQEEKEALLTEDDLKKISEHRFYVNMSLKDRLEIRKNMEQLRAEHKIYMSDVLKTVMLKYMNDKDFLNFIGLLEKPEGVLWYNWG